MHNAVRVLVVLSVAVCSMVGIARADDPERAIVEPASVTASADIERILDLDADRDAPTGMLWYEVIKGDSPIIISAPHATKVFRENAWRFSDGGGTAALAEQLHELAHVSVIHTTFRAPSDPNYYDDNDYKRQLESLAKDTHAQLLLDIHGSDSLRPYDVDVGTMNGASLLGHTAFQEALIRELRAHGLEAISSNYFAASKNHTVTRFASEHGIPAMQLEINSTLLDPAGGDVAGHRFAALLDALTDFLRAQDFGKSH